MDKELIKIKENLLKLEDENNSYSMDEFFNDLKKLLGMEIL